MNLYLVMSMRPWSAIKISVSPFGGDQPLRVDGLGVGFVPAFQTREEAEAFAPGSEIVEVSVRRETGEEVVR